MAFIRNNSTKLSTPQKSENSVSNPLATIISTLLNAQRAGHQSIQLSPNRCGGFILPVLAVLANEGYIQKVETNKVNDTSQKGSITVHLRYDGRGQPAIRDIRPVSLPSRRLYLPASAL